jgi:hypothetical protein
VGWCVGSGQRATCSAQRTTHNAPCGARAAASAVATAWTRTADGSANVRYPWDCASGTVQAGPCKWDCASGTAQVGLRKWDFRTHAFACARRVKLAHTARTLRQPLSDCAAKETTAARAVPGGTTFPERNGSSQRPYSPQSPPISRTWPMDGSCGVEIKRAACRGWAIYSRCLLIAALRAVPRRRQGSPLRSLRL